MSDKLLDKYTGGPAANAAAPPDGEDAESLECFGWLRGSARERAIMLELRKKDGHVMAVAYAHIERVEYKPEEGMTLYLPGGKVRIKGSGLNSEARPGVRLFDGVIRHRVPWIREADRSALLKVAQSAVVVESIAWDE